MRKSLIIASLLLSTSAIAGEQKYTLTGYKILSNECGHAQDLLKDTYRIAFTAEGVKVNYTNWKEYYESDNSFLLEYRAQPNAYTGLDLVYFKDIHTGYLTLTGATENRDVCFDRISLKG